nr:MAG TPA: hypothetical protein [Caudoviricetes sp.]
MSIRFVIIFSFFYNILKNKGISGFFLLFPSPEKKTFYQIEKMHYSPYSGLLFSS